MSQLCDKRIFCVHIQILDRLDVFDFGQNVSFLFIFFPGLSIMYHKSWM
jgi:hypothetical protein